MPLRHRLPGTRSTRQRGAVSAQRNITAAPPPLDLSAVEPNDLQSGRPLGPPANVYEDVSGWADVEGRASHAATTPDGVEAAPLDAPQLWERYGAQVYKFAAMVSRGDVEAEDLAQEALVRAIRALPAFQHREGKTEAWLWRIVVNTARDLGRTARRRALLIERLLSLHSDPMVIDDIEAHLTANELLEAVRSLPARQRTLIALRFASDLDYGTIGHLLGLSPVGARSATRRALATLRQRLEVSITRRNDS